VRVFELARELGVKSKELVEYLGLGSHMEEVNPEAAYRARGEFGRVRDERSEVAFNYREDFAETVRNGERVLVQGGAYFSYGERGNFDMVSSRWRLVPEPRFLGWVG